MRRLIIILITAFAITINAAALHVPDIDVSENRDGRQLIIKTFSLLPSEDPEALIEEPFRREGFDYSFVSIVKYEKLFESKETHSETVTVETASDDLGEILGALDALIPYDDGTYSGKLALDHTTLRTEATGYSTRNYTVSDTKTYEGLDRNDPNFIPRTTVKNGVTLALQNIDWAPQGTAISGDSLVVTQYMATASYSAGTSRRVADGYVTTAVYSGEIVSSGIDSIVYTVTYIGEPIPSPEPMPEPEPAQEPEPEPEPDNDDSFAAILRICAGMLLLILTAIALYFILRNNTKIYATDSSEDEYELIGKQRISPRELMIDLLGCDRYPEGTAVIAIKRLTARRLFGRIIKIRLRNGSTTHMVEQVGNADYMFSVSTTEEG